jgi:COP9 signalosome complex subunit 3
LLVACCVCVGQVCGDKGSGLELNSECCCRALLSNHCAIGYSVLQNTLYQLGDTALNATDYLLYCYYGGLVCIGCRKLAKASELLLLAITMPTQVPDAIILAAWQKYVMIYALQTGSLPV